MPPFIQNLPAWDRLLSVGERGPLVCFYLCIGDPVTLDRAFVTAAPVGSWTFSQWRRNVWLKRGGGAVGVWVYKPRDTRFNLQHPSQFSSSLQSPRHPHSASSFIYSLELHNENLHHPLCHPDPRPSFQRQCVLILSIIQVQRLTYFRSVVLKRLPGGVDPNKPIVPPPGI